MSNKKKVILSLLFFTFLGVFLTNKVYADISISGVKDIIVGLTDMTYDGPSQFNCRGVFKPTFKFGKKCNGGICGNAIKHFKCISYGVMGCATENEVNSIKVESMSNSDADEWRDPDGENVYKTGHPNNKKYEYYKVTMYTDSGLQNVQGVVYKKKRYTVTVKPVDKNGQSLVGVAGLSEITETKDAGSKVSLKHQNTSAGYTFREWRSSSWGYLAGSDLATYTIDELTKNITLYAVYGPIAYESGLWFSVNDTTTGATGGTIYTKPNRLVNFNVGYNSGAQQGAFLQPQVAYINCNTGTVYRSPGKGKNSKNNLAGLFNSIGSCGAWNNNLYVNLSTGQSNNRVYGIGPVSDSYATPVSINSSHVGTNIVGNAWTDNQNPRYIEVGLSGKTVVANVLTGLSGTANAIVPYNFDNTPGKPGHPGEGDPEDPNDDDPNNPGTNSNGDEKIVYAGEEDTFNYTIKVRPRSNPNTGGGDYATVAPGSKWKFEMCVGEANCNSNYYSYSYEKTGTLNEKGLEIGDVFSEDIKINIPDIKAGSRICVRTSVWPADSGLPTNWQISGYTDRWDVSKRSCYTVAKKPSIQFWGGNVYSRANIATSTAKKVKNNLEGYSSSYSAFAEGEQPIVAFGSWGELGVVGNGSITEFGSGASMGYVSINGVDTWPKYNPSNGLGNNASIQGAPGGSEQRSFCKRIPLTIPNSPCDVNSVFGSNSVTSINKAASDKSSIVDLLASGERIVNRVHDPDGGVVNMSVVNGINDSTTKVISSNNDIIINEDLDYLSGEFKNYGEMPKLVIYSRGNIYIECNVRRIDALLIADDTVATCKNFEDNPTDQNVKKHINDKDNSTQLLVNGAIIAKKLVANRTYGAATGANSIVPAEIVNFDPTLYLFGNTNDPEDDKSSAGRLDVVYVREMAPRL